MLYTAYTHANIYTPEGIVTNGTLVVDSDGKVHSISKDPNFSKENCEVVELRGRIILPGLIDIHTHGANGYCTMDGNYESLNEFSKFHAAHGTTSFLATTTTGSDDHISKALQAASEAMNRGVSGAELVGVHLEGPFIDTVRRGAQDLNYITLPTEELMENYQRLSGDQIKLVTLAPEVEGGLDAVRWYSSRGVTVSIGHSNAVFAEVEQAVALGASHTTHHFNGMSPLHHREPGVAGAGLILPELTTEIIADGIHVHPELIKLLFQVKGASNVCIITDSVQNAGLPDGEYGNVTMKDGVIILTDGGNLAGSSLTTLQALRNVITFTGLSIEQVLPSITEVPARQAGLSKRKGSLAPGMDADFIVVSNDLELQQTFVNGKEVWKAF